MEDFICVRSKIPSETDCLPHIIKLFKFEIIFSNVVYFVSFFLKNLFVLLFKCVYICT